MAARKTTITAEDQIITAPVKRVKKTDEVASLAPVTKVAAKKDTGLTVDVFDTTGKVTATLSLPEEIFGAKINDALMSQAVRVYLANQRSGTASTKTRGEVQGSTRKIYRQKGTGRARHGGIRAPIFVGGGIAHGPRAHDFSLTMPKKMRRLALFSAITTKQQAGSIKIVDGFEALEPKTKVFAAALNALVTDKKKKVLFVLPGKTDNVEKASRNLEGVTYVLANQLNTYDVLNTKTIVMMKPAIETMTQTFIKESK